MENALKTKFSESQYCFANISATKAQIFMKFKLKLITLYLCWSLPCRYMVNKTKVDSVQLGRLLKLPIFIVQKDATPKNVVEFCQEYIAWCHQM